MNRKVGMSPDLERRARVHAALGDPVRLAIIDELRLSDRSPGELATQFSLPTNLIAHHLDVLSNVGLIERIVSAGDRRRKYVRLLPAGVAATDGVRESCPDRVMFVCTRNSARSQLASAIWKERTGDTAPSAGTSPAPQVHPGAVAAARRAGLDLSGAVPRAWRGVPARTQVITVCDLAHEEFHTTGAHWHWSVPDPVEVGTSDAFDATVAELDLRITTLTSPQGPR